MAKAPTPAAPSVPAEIQRLDEAVAGLRASTEHIAARVAALNGLEKRVAAIEADLARLYDHGFPARPERR